MSSLPEAEHSVLLAGVDDWIGLWTVVREVKERRPGLSPEELRGIVVNLVRELVEKNCVQIGRPDAEGKFEPWDESAGDAAARIDREWRALGRDPDIGEICWLENTPCGDRLALESDSR